MVPFHVGWVRAGLGLGLTGELCHAWVWCMAWCMGWCMGGGDVGDGLGSVKLINGQLFL